MIKSFKNANNNGLIVFNRISGKKFCRNGVDD